MQNNYFTIPLVEKSLAWAGTKVLRKYQLMLQGSTKIEWNILCSDSSIYNLFGIISPTYIEGQMICLKLCDKIIS